MGLLDKLFGNKKATTNEVTALVTKTSLPAKNDILPIHQDLLNVLWLADGAKKNYVSKNNDSSFEFEGIRITISSFSNDEPSLISMKLPIQNVSDNANIDRPPYYPTYQGLTNEQRGLYWRLLANPYSGQFDIGFVFVLYYGLERHLLEGDFEQAFRVILKLRDVYDNKSFQSYSACALILTCLFRQRADLIEVFYNSLDKEYELSFSDDLYLLCKMGLDIPLTPKDVMRMAKAFEFSNQNYIKKQPQIFEDKLAAIMQEKYEQGLLSIKTFVTTAEWKKIHKKKLPVFANVSLREQSVDIPMFTECFKLKREIYNLLEAAHEETKTEISQLRKNGELPTEETAKGTKSKAILAFDTVAESDLLKKYKSTGKDILDKHFALIALQDFYYKYRDVDVKYLQTCIAYCKEDIALLPQMQAFHRKQEESDIRKLEGIYSKHEITTRVADIGPFVGNIPAFKRLAVVFDKNKDYGLAVDICEQAIEYYNSIDSKEAARDFAERKAKIEAKITNSGGKY